MALCIAPAFWCSARRGTFARLWYRNRDKFGAPNNLGLAWNNRQCRAKPGRECFAISLGHLGFSIWLEIGMFFKLEQMDRRKHPQEPT